MGQFDCNSATSAIVANELDDKPIPERFGGPITLVHKTEVSMDRYPWYLETIILGDVIEPELKLVYENGATKDLSWKFWNQNKESRSKEMVFPSPRGRRLNGIDTSAVKSTISYLPLSRILDQKNPIGITLTSFSKISAAIDLSPENLSTYSIAYARNGKEIPAYEGGPFILFKEGEPKDMNPKFHITKITISPKGK